MQSELLRYIRKEVGAGAIGSGDVIGVFGDPLDIYYFWQEVGKRTGTKFAYEAIAFLHIVERTSRIKDPEILRGFVGWHGQIGENPNYKRDPFDLLKVRTLNSLIVDTETIIDYIEKSGRPAFANIHEPVISGLNGAVERVKCGTNAYLLYENDFGHGSSLRTCISANLVGDKGWLVFDLGHAAMEFTNFNWQKDYEKVTDLLWKVGHKVAVLHVPVGTVFDSIPANLPPAFYNECQRAQEEFGFILEFETQMKNPWESIYRNRAALDKFMPYVIERIKPWKARGMLNRFNHV